MLRTIKRFILNLFTPIQKMMQKLGKAEPLMTRNQVDEILNLAKQGDILLSYETQRFTSNFIKGYYKHAAIISSKMTVVEAVGSGVREVDLEEWLFDKDSVCLIRSKYDFLTAKEAAANAIYYIGKPYDYSFSLVDERVYCSELIYLCYAKIKKDFLSNIDHENILPNEYYEQCFEADSQLMLIKQFKNV